MTDLDTIAPRHILAARLAEVNEEAKAISRRGEVGTLSDQYRWLHEKVINSLLDAIESQASA